MTAAPGSAAEVDAALRARLLEFADALDTLAAEARREAGEPPQPVTAAIEGALRRFLRSYSLPAADLHGAAVIAAGKATRMIAEVLRAHYLTGITCDHRMKADNPVCACSLVNLGWHPSVGEAVEAWVEHVLTVAATEPAGEET